MQLLKKFHRNILKMRGGGRQFSETDPGKIANSLTSIIAKKGEVEYFSNFFCNVALFDAFYQNYHVWMENVLQS